MSLPSIFPKCKCELAIVGMSSSGRPHNSPCAIFSTHSDETVEVGSPLYEIDTEATASVATSSSSKASDAAPPCSPPPPPKEAPAEQPAVAAATATTTTSSSPAPQQRTPSIHFLGKEGWAARLRGAPVVELPPIHPMYGRPAFSEEEMEAFMLGGAEQAPKIVSLSTGATFSY